MGQSEAPPRLLSMRELADLVGVSYATVRQWRARGSGPRGIRVGRHVRFRPDDIDAWLERNADDQDES